ncbi:hypothetical protein BH09ACT6_BH09ACT6_24550 [soil metagenome]
MPSNSAAADASNRGAAPVAAVPADTHLGPLAERLRAVAPHFFGPEGVSHGQSEPGDLALAILRVVSASSHRDAYDRDVWLAIVAFTAVYPTTDEHRSVQRALRLADEGAELTVFLEALEPIIRRSYHLDDRIEVVSHAVVVDADFTGRSDHNTGVQRVLRETASRWNGEHDITLVCWNDDSSGMRRLVGTEITRVTDWARHSTLPAAERRAPDDLVGAGAPAVIVPVDSVIVEIEVAQLPVAAPLAALAAVSGNAVVMVGHDTIPIVSADSQDAAEIERFARYLTVVKHATRVAGVSGSAAEEFSGFVSALGAQGVTGPDVIAVPLAMNAPSHRAAVGAHGGGARPDAPAAPLVLVVGSQEPRKNHGAILFAAQRLWAEGIAFRLRFIGGGSAATIHRFDAELRRLRAGGAEVEVLRGASDTVLLESYREARFTVFPSLHEGFGLPVAESLALGTPVITADHGSLREAAVGGGCLTVDARDDEALRVAMKSLLCDEALYERLRSEALERSFRTWNDYAAELWLRLVQPAQLSPAEHSTDVARTAECAATEGAAAAVGAGSRSDDRVLETWWVQTTEAVRRHEARRNSIVGKVGRVGPLVRFFVVRSREMGVVAASKAAVRIVRRRLAAR